LDALHGWLLMQRRLEVIGPLAASHSGKTAFAGRPWNHWRVLRDASHRVKKTRHSPDAHAHLSHVDDAALAAAVHATSR
jgi:hypothetical protein